MRLFSLAVVVLAGCAGASRAQSSLRRDEGVAPPTGAPRVSRASPEDALVGVLVAELNASSVGDCNVEYRSSGDGDGSGLIIFHGAERQVPPSPPGPPAQIMSHASLQTERYQSPGEVESAVRARRSQFEECMRERPDDHRVRKGMSVRAETCGVSFLPYVPTAHYADQFRGSSVVTPHGRRSRVRT